MVYVYSVRRMAVSSEMAAMSGRFEEAIRRNTFHTSRSLVHPPRILIRRVTPRPGGNVTNYLYN